LAAVKQNGLVLEHIANQAQIAEDIFFLVLDPSEISKDHEYYQKFYDLWQDREILVQAVGQNGLALKFVGEEGRGDQDVVSAAVSQNGIALFFAAENMCADPQIVLQAIGNNPWAFELSTFEIRDNHQFVLKAMKSSI
jgi:hypothetical protein